MTKAPFLSIIIPAYNEENRLPKSLAQIAAFLQQQDYSYEVIVVENNSRDRTYQIASEFAEQHPYAQALHEDQGGKGRAIRRGMLAAQGRYRFMCDADLSMPIEEIVHFLAIIDTEADIVIGSREVTGAVRYDEPDYRHIGGRGINLMIRLLALPNLSDTQCGFKLFTEQAAIELFTPMTIMGWSFDIEVLYLARQRGYRIVELGIPWYFDADTRLNPFRDTLQFGLDLLQVRLNHLLGRYRK